MSPAARLLRRRHVCLYMVIPTLLCSLLTGCGEVPKPGAATSKPAEPGSAAATNPEKPHSRPLTIFAAASTAATLERALEAFRAAHPGEISVSSGSTAQLGGQIRQGATADLFLAASSSWGDRLVKEEHSLQRVDLLGNRLVIIVPPGAPQQALQLTELGHPNIERIALADPQSVPAGIYAQQALVKAGIWQIVEPRLIIGDDVNQVVLVVSRGETDAGIAYATDARLAKVRIVGEIDPAMHEPIRYPLLLIKQQEPHPLAEELFRYLQSPAALKIFEEQGFSRLPADLPAKKSA